MAITQQASKLRPNDLYNGGGSGVRTTYMKFEFAGDFNKVQHLIGSKVASGTPGTYKVQFAVTDAIAVDTVANAYLPVRAGVTYNDKSANGWKDATFGGAASKQIGLAPSAGNNSIIHMSTDVMDLVSIPRADGKAGGILLVKVTQTDASGGYTAANGASNAWDSARGQPWFTEWYSKSVTGDAIADLTKLPTGAPYNEDYAFPGFAIVTNTQSTLPTDLLLFTGDSRKSAAYMSNLFGNPARKSAMSLSTAAHPISTVNGAGSGHSQSQFLAIAMDMINAGLRPTVVHVPGFSQNGFTTFAAYKTNLDNFMASVRAVAGLSNVKFILDTDYWVTGYSFGTAPENGRRECVAYAKSLHNGTTVFCFDSDAIITDYSDASAPTFKSAYYSGTSFIGGDGVHAGPVGLDAMSYGDGTLPGLQSVYRTAFGLDAPAADTTAPVMTGSITVSAITSAGFTLSVGAATDAVGVAGYEYSIDGGTNYTTIANAARTVTVTGRAASTSHPIRMRAFDAAGNRATPLSATATTTAAADTTAPVMIGSVTVTDITSSGATMSWQAATDAVGVAGYEYNVNGGTYVNNGTNRTISITGLQAITPASGNVRAYDAAGNRATPLAFSFTTLAVAPERPMQFTPSAARTLTATVSSSTPFGAPATGGFWNLSSNPKKPVGTKDPDATIDITLDWSPIFSDITDTILAGSGSILLSPPQVGTPALVDAGSTVVGTQQTVFLSGGTTAGDYPVTFRVSSASTPPRKFDRTIIIRIEDQ